MQHLRALLTSSVTDEDEEEAGDAGKEVDKEEQRGVRRKLQRGTE